MRVSLYLSINVFFNAVDFPLFSFNFYLFAYRLCFVWIGVAAAVD